MVERAIRVTENNAGSSADEFASRSFPIGEDMALQKREWLLERAAWIGMALVLLLALLGAFSRGPLSDARAAAPNGSATIDYDRFLRAQAMTRFTIAGAFAGDELELRLGHGFLDAFEVRAIQPQPLGSRSDNSAVYYMFPLRDPGAPVRITIDAKRVDWGASTAEFGFGGANGITLNQFAYP
jgi:hypothetical protein